MARPSRRCRNVNSTNRSIKFLDRLCGREPGKPIEPFGKVVEGYPVTTRLDFSIGPVQGFVSQSRRTRDLWGSSYLLSRFCPPTPCAVPSRRATGSCSPDAGAASNRIGSTEWVSGHREGDPPRTGSLPNHFTVEVEGDAAEAAHAGKRSLQAAWNRVCRAVWSRFVEPACSHGSGTEDIWTRQIESFWEVMWTASKRR